MHQMAFADDLPVLETMFDVPFRGIDQHYAILLTSFTFGVSENYAEKKSTVTSINTWP